MGMAETFGQLQNANIIYLTKENNILCKTLYLHKFNEPLENNNKENKVLIQLSQISQNMPALINYENIVGNIEKQRLVLDFVILKEVHTYKFI